MRKKTGNEPRDHIRTLKRLFKVYKIAGGTVGFIAIAYLLLLYYPQPLFAYSTTYERFEVHSREPIDAGLDKVLDRAETLLKTSPLYDAEVRRPIFLTNGFGMYALLSHKAYNSFGNSVPFVTNVFINKTDIPGDWVFMNRAKNNSRSLSVVIAHEITHIFIRQRYGTVTSMLQPAWKNEGYCEYIAGESTIPLDEGLRLWRENPSDDTGYRFTKYRAMVKYLLEKENMTVDELFNRTLDQKEVEARTLADL